jgi:hypothetical protein
MMEGTGFANSMETNGISPKHFKNGWAFFTFTMTADLENSNSFELIKSGTTSILIRFAHKVKPSGLQMIDYGVSAFIAAFVLDAYFAIALGDGFINDAGPAQTVDQ